MAYGCTPRLREALDFLTEWDARRPGTFPSLGDLVGLSVASSKGDAHRLLQGLVERGHLFRSGRGHSRQYCLTGARTTPPATHAPDGAPLFFLPAPHKTGAPC